MKNLLVTLRHIGKQNWNGSSLESTKKERRQMSPERDRYHATVKTLSVRELAFLLIAFCPSRGNLSPVVQNFMIFSHWH